MELNINDGLIKLAKVFKKNGARLFIVGGFIRNAILGFCETDIDICSKLLPEEIERMLDKKKFTVKIINSKLGTVHIKVKDEDIEYEHTTFRAEKYQQGGNHSPKEVKFVDDISLDASRRDFSANSIYYDILSGEIVDFYNGVLDVKSHILKTIETPEYVFSRDGLRILRMVRIASELGFDIEKHTFDVAKNLSNQLADISQERFNKEVVSIIFSDYKYDAIDNPTSYIKGLKQINQLNAWEFVLPKFTELIGKTRIQSLYKSEWLNLIVNAQPALRISALVIDICKGVEIVPNKQVVYSILGLGGIMLNKHECERQFKIIDAFTKIYKGEIYNDEIGRIFIQNNYDNLREILALCDLAQIGSKLSKLYYLMQIDNVPFNLKQLKINGNDLKTECPNIERCYYSKILNKLLNNCAIMPEFNRKDLLINSAEQIYQDLKN